MRTRISTLALGAILSVGTIATAQNVGIGVATPLERLHIAGGARVNSLAGVNSRLVMSDANGTLTNLAAGTANYVLTQGATAPQWSDPAGLFWRVGGNTLTAVGNLGTNSAHDLPIVTSGVERARITAAGNMGVGDATPAALFTVGNGDLFQVVSTGHTRTINASAAAPAYSFTADATSGLYRFGVNDVRMSIGGVDRMRFGVNGNAEVWVNQASPYVGDNFSSTSALVGDFGVSGYNLGAVATGGGIYAEARGATTFGAWIANLNANGTGCVAYGNNGGSTTLVTGSGGAFTGTITGAYARSSTGGVGQALYTDQFGAITRVNYWSGALQYKILGTGSVSTIVADADGQQRVMFCPESPEILFTDYGTGHLINGRAQIQIDPILARNILVDDEHPLKVFIQLEDNETCQGVVVKNKTGNGFEVVEMNGGTSNTPFSYTIVATRRNETLPNGRVARYQEQRFPIAPAPEATSEAARRTPAR